MNKKVKILLAVVIGLLFSLSFLFFYRNYYNTKPKASTDNTWNFTFDGQDGVGSDKYLLNVMVKPPVNAQPGANKIRSLKLIFKYPNSLFNDISSSDIVLQSPFVQSKTQASGVVPGTNEIELSVESGLDEKGNLLPQSPLIATINFTKKLPLVKDIEGRFEFKSFKLIDGLGVEVTEEATKVDLPIIAGPDGKIRVNLRGGIGDSVNFGDQQNISPIPFNKGDVGDFNPNYLPNEREHFITDPTVRINSNLSVNFSNIHWDEGDIDCPEPRILVEIGPDPNNLSVAQGCGETWTGDQPWSCTSQPSGGPAKNGGWTYSGDKICVRSKLKFYDKKGATCHPPITSSTICYDNYKEPPPNGKTCSVEQPRVNDDGSVTFKWKGRGNTNIYGSPEVVRASLLRKDGAEIIKRPLDISEDYESITNTYYYTFFNNCSSFNSEECQVEQTIYGLPLGDYYFNCIINMYREVPGNICTGFPYCDFNGGSYSCPDYFEDCSNNDFVEFTIPSNSSVTNTPTPTKTPTITPTPTNTPVQPTKAPTLTPTKTPTNTPTKTPTITPTITTSPSCQCTNNKCTDSCKDASGGKLINFACSTIVNCSTDRNRTKGDSIGTTMTCLDDYVELMNAIHGKYNGKDEQNKVRRLRSDFNGDDEVGNKDLEIFKANYKPEDCMVGIPPIPPP